MTYLIVMPVINKEITHRSLKSIDKAIYEKMLLIDNSADNFAKDYPIESIYPQENIGVARSWNAGAIRVLNGIDYLILVSATMVFKKGMLDFISYLELNLNPYGLETQHGWHCIAIGRKTLETIGLFDENFYPAYYEDSDYIRRMELAGIHNPMSATARLPKVEIAAGYQGNAHAVKNGVNVNMQACRDYFVDKWGKDPRYEAQAQRDELFKYPFNNPENSLSYWPKVSVTDLTERYKLNEES